MEGENQVHTCVSDLRVPAGALTSTCTLYRKTLKDLGHKTVMSLHVCVWSVCYFDLGSHYVAHTGLEFVTSCPLTQACQGLNTISVSPNWLHLEEKGSFLSLPPSPASSRACVLSTSSLFKFSWMFFTFGFTICLTYKLLCGVSHLIYSFSSTSSFKISFIFECIEQLDHCFREYFIVRASLCYETFNFEYLLSYFSVFKIQTRSWG